MIETYYIKELQNGNSMKGKVDHIVEASNLTSAKIQASKKQLFYGTVLELYYDKDCKCLAATKINNKWKDVQDGKES